MRDVTGLQVFFLLTTLIILSRCAWLVFVPAQAALRAWRAEHYAKAAAAAMAEGDYRQAGPLVAAAVDLSPKRPSVLRAQAQFYSHSADPRGLTHWQMLADSGSATRADHLAHARAALALSRADQARAVLKPLHLADPKDPEVLALVSEVFALEGDNAQAISALRDALSRVPDNQDYERQVGALELRSPGAAEQTMGKARLLSLLAHARQHRWEIARLLVTEGRLTDSEETLLLRLLDARGDDASEGNVIRLALALLHEPGRMAELLQQYLPPSARDPETLRTAANLLGELGLYRAVVALVPHAAAVRDPALALLRLGALAATGEWTEMNRLLTNPALPLSAPAQAIFRAGVAQLAGQTNEAVSLWLTALSACHWQPKFAEMLAIHAELVGAPEPAIRAWEHLLDDPFRAGKAARELIRLGALYHDLRATRAALERLVQMRPREPQFRIQLALAQLLLGEDEEEARTALKELEPGFRDDPVYCISAALAAVRAGAPDQAAEWIARPAIQWSNAPPVWRIIRVAALGQSGQKISARRAAAGIDASRLTQQEFALISPWLPER